LIFGSSYLMAENALRILVFGFLISSIFNVSQHLMQMIGKSKLLLVDTMFLTIVNIILNFFLIPKYGLNGREWCDVAEGPCSCGAWHH